MGYLKMKITAFPGENFHGALNLDQIWTTSKDIDTLYLLPADQKLMTVRSYLRSGRLFNLS